MNGKLLKHFVVLGKFNVLFSIHKLFQDYFEFPKCRHLLRLGHGEEALGTEKDFSKYGRVNYILAHRLELLEEIGRLQKSLGVMGDVNYTCETAGYFNLYQVSFT